MFEKLKARWKVNGLNLVLIIATFAMGGSLCGFAGRKLLMLTNLEKGSLWVFLYIILVSLLWPLCVLLISIPLGQFGFFKNYIKKIWKKMSRSAVQADAGRKNNNNQQQAANLAIFASGSGSNAEQLIKFSHSPNMRGATDKGANGPAYQVALIICNKPNAGVLKIAEKASIPSILIEKDRFFNVDHYLPELRKHNIDLIVLAGFLWKIPGPLIQAYPKKIINIHPALLPKYGGKGMYGNKVHETVIAAGENKSGITIHYVDELYDHGEMIFQATCEITGDDTAETLAQKIHVLEHTHYPKLIAEVLQKQNRS